MRCFYCLLISASLLSVSLAQVEEFDPDNLCSDPTFDTILSTTDNKIYVLKGDKYWLVTPRKSGDGYRLADGYPQLISSVFPGLPANIQAGFSDYRKKKTHFFKGDQTWRYDNYKLDAGYPKSMKEAFPNASPDISLAFMCTGFTYMVNGNEAYSQGGNRRPVNKVWRGLPNQLDGAMQLSSGGHTYFFQGRNYYKVMVRTQAVEQADPPYPRPIKDYWFQCEEDSAFIPLEQPAGDIHLQARTG